MKSIYLTMDDSPSFHLDKKIDFFVEHKIPVVIFSRGECIRPNKEKLIKAIQSGFLVGNHSYSHPRFSQLSLEKCFEEVLKTEQLIEDCYAEAGVTRPAKVIRLPYGDRGAGDHARPPQASGEQVHVEAIQSFLQEQGFQSLSFSGLEDTMIDAYWTWDTEDYKQTFIEAPFAYEQALHLRWRLTKRPAEVMLIHDFSNNHHLFEVTMKFLLDKQVTFLTPELPSR